MPNRSRKRLPDPNVTAFRFVQALTGKPIAPPTPDPDLGGKDPAAVALGRKGGLKGGKARAAAMTKKERLASAKKGRESPLVKVINRLPFSLCPPLTEAPP
jgi:hypothetical protein